MFPGWVLQVRMSVVCRCLGVGWLYAVWVQCGPLCWNSLDALWVRAVLVVMMRGEWGECTRWDEWDVDLVFDVSLVSAVYLNNGTTVVRSWNITHFMDFSLGSWKGVNIVTFARFLLLQAFGGSWNDVPLWHSGFKWAWFLLYLLPFGPSMMYERPCSKISTTVPVNHFSFVPVLLLWKESNLFFCFQNFLILGSGELGQNVLSACFVSLVVIGGFLGC